MLACSPVPWAGGFISGRRENENASYGKWGRDYPSSRRVPRVATEPRVGRLDPVELVQVYGWL